MKKSTFKSIVNNACMVIGICGFLTVFGMMDMWTATYKIDAKVTKVNNSVVTVVDTRNEEWEFEGTNFKIGDKVELSMYTNNTDSYIYDDEIKNVKKIKKA